MDTGKARGTDTDMCIANDQEGEKKDIFNKDVTDFILARA